MEINHDYVINSELLFDELYDKKQIVLTNTGLPIGDFLTKITKRYNGKYDKVPTYTIDRSGTLYSHYDAKRYTNFFSEEYLKRHSIAIALENVGWLNLDEATGVYKDWRGAAYNGDVIDKNWRNKKHWASYTDKQISALLDLIDYLCIEYSINRKFIGSNVLVENSLTYKGIVSRSNFNKNYIDLTTAFEFDKLNDMITK